MPLKFFHIASRDSAPMEAELNAFISRHRIVIIDRRFVEAGAGFRAATRWQGRRAISKASSGIFMRAESFFTSPQSNFGPWRWASVNTLLRSRVANREPQTQRQTSKNTSP
jgi:hypothetical protein